MNLAPPDFSGADGFPEVLVEGRIVSAGFERARIFSQHLGGAVARGFLKGRVHIFDVPPRVGDDDGVGALLDGGQEFLPVILRLLVRGDVNQRHAACGRAVFVHPCGHLQMREEGGPVMPDHPEIALLRLPRLQEALPAPVVEVLTFLGDKCGQAPSDQRAAPQVEECGGGEVRFEDQALLAERAIADRGQIVEVEIPRPGGVQLRLRPPQLLVLHLEFDLVHAQLVERGAQGFRRQGIEILRRAVEGFPEELFRPLAERGRLRRLLVFGAHGERGGEQYPMSNKEFPISKEGIASVSFNGVTAAPSSFLLSRRS